MKGLPGKAGYAHYGNRVTCKKCGCPDLMWTKNKAGRYYLCYCMPSKSTYKREGDVMVACPWRPHKCEEYLAALELDRKNQEEAEAKRVKAEKIFQIGKDENWDAEKIVARLKEEGLI